jgi:uncharacterized membrane protein
VVATLDRAEADAESLLGLSPRAAAVVAWAGAWVTGGLVCWLAPDGARFVRHHARHALWVTGGVTALAVTLWLLSILSAFLITPTTFAVVSWLATGAWVAVLPFWAWGLFRAVRGDTLRMPGVTRRIESASEVVLPAPPPVAPTMATHLHPAADAAPPYAPGPKPDAFDSRVVASPADSARSARLGAPPAQREGGDEQG